MPAHGYLIYMVRAGVPYRPNELYRLNEAGEQGVDLLGQLFHHLDGFSDKYHPVDKNAEGFRVKELAVRGRTIWVKINRGPAGSPGEAYNLDTGDSTETTERQALLSGLRALFILPADSYYGLLFIERVGRRTLQDLLDQIAIRPAVATSAAQIKVEGFAELSDWRRELSDMQVLRVSESFVKHDSGADASSVEDTLVSISAEGGVLRRMSDSIKDVFSTRVQRRDRRHDLLERSSQVGERRRQAEKDGVTFQDEAEFQAIRQELQNLNSPTPHSDSLAGIVDEVLDIDRETLQHKRYEFALGHDRPERTIVIERDTIPQFIYELGGRLTDSALRDTWVQHAQTILGARGVTLPAGWDSKLP